MARLSMRSRSCSRSGCSARTTAPWPRRHRRDAPGARLRVDVGAGGASRASRWSCSTSSTSSGTLMATAAPGSASSTARWLACRGLTMRQVGRAGEKGFVDYAGKKLRFTDPVTGERIAVELFVLRSGRRDKTYAEATATQQTSPTGIARHIPATWDSTVAASRHLSLARTARGTGRLFPAPPDRWRWAAGFALCYSFVRLDRHARLHMKEVDR